MRTGGRDRDRSVVVRVPGAVCVAGCHRRDCEDHHEQARDPDRGRVEVTRDAVPAEESDRSSDDRDRRKQRCERVLEPDRFDGAEWATDVGDARQRPNGDATCVEQDTGDDQQAVRTEHHKRCPAKFRGGAEREEPRESGFVAVTPGSRGMDESGSC